MNAQARSKREKGKSMNVKNVIFWATVASGVVAAYLMYRRGERPVTIARETIQNPVGSLVREAQAAV